jgi:hypothetical protein
MDNYTSSLVQLDGGLDLITAKPGAKPGTLSNCLNFEVVDRSGYKIIDGFELFDGRVNPVDQLGLGTLRHIRCSGNSDIESAIYIGESLVIEGTTNVFGILVYATQTGISNPFTYNIYYKPVEESFEPAISQDVSRLGAADTLTVTIAPSNVPASTAVGIYNDQAAVFRATVGELPDTAIGLHLFRDKLYAVVDYRVVHFNSGGTTEPFIGDIIQDSTNANATIIDIDLDSGTWAGGDATGKFLISTDSVNTFGSGNIDLVRPNTAEISNIATITSGSTAPWKAGLWKALSEDQATEEGGSATTGWNRIDTGLIIEFEDGSIDEGEFPHIDRRTQEINTEYGTDSTDVTGTNGIAQSGQAGFLFSGDPSTDGSTLAAALDAPSIVYSTNSADLVAVAAAAEDPNVDVVALVFQSSGSDFGYTKVGPRVGLTNLNTVTTIPGYAIIKGVEVYLDNVTPLATASAGQIYSEISLEASLFKYDPTAPTKLGTGKASIITNQNGVATGQVDLVLGSSSDLWGNTSLSLNDVINANFGVTLRATHSLVGGSNSVGGTALSQVMVDRVRVKIYYEKQFTRYYFYNATDGVNEVQADMIDYRVFDGDLELGNGEGVMQFVDVTNVTGGTRRVVKVGDFIQLATGGSTATRVGQVTAVRSNSLPSKADILEEESRYQFITANFYGNDEWDAFYGVSGAGRAFSYDDTYFVTIFTQDDDEKDKPRHIAYHHWHLALGFRSGSVQFSVV